MTGLKLRAWDEQNKVMHNDFQFIASGSEGSNGNDWIVFTSHLQKLTATPHPFKNPHFRRQFKIMEFTGLKGKDGTDIYEGDVVKGITYLGCVVFMCGSYGIFQHKIFIPFTDLIDVDFRVIGNIYENPELKGEVQ